MTVRITDYATYWSYYIDQHHYPANRALHYLGSMTAAGLITAGLVLQLWWMIAAAPAIAFGGGMLGHALFEKTPPEKHRYPLWALVSDFRMLHLFLCGRIGREFICADGKQTT